MDLRTGKLYDTKEAALVAGVPESDIAEIHDALEKVQFKSGPFKDRLYERMPNGQLVRVK